MNMHIAKEQTATLQIKQTLQFVASSAAFIEYLDVLNFGGVWVFFFRHLPIGLNQ